MPSFRSFLSSFPFRMVKLSEWGDGDFPFDFGTWYNEHQINASTSKFLRYCWIKSHWTWYTLNGQGQWSVCSTYLWFVVGKIWNNFNMKILQKKLFCKYRCLTSLIVNSGRWVSNSSVALLLPIIDITNASKMIVEMKVIKHWSLCDKRSQLFFHSNTFLFYLLTFWLGVIERVL